MRAVPVLLASNSNGEGYGPEYGSVVVDSVDDMAAAAGALLDDPERLAVLAESGYRTARQDGDWEAYKQRLRDAVVRPDAVVAAGGYVRAAVGRRIADEHARVLRELAQSERGLVELERERARLVADGELLRERMVALWTQLDETSQRAQELNEGLLGLLSSSSWRVTKPLRATVTAVRAFLRIGGSIRSSGRS